MRVVYEAVLACAILFVLWWLGRATVPNLDALKAFESQKTGQPGRP